jgi:MoaA/NifB/PqqE/SkfB family radical SAM enzyme
MKEKSLSKSAAQERSYHDRRMVISDFSQSPFVIAWEVTHACAFACVHCRADAQRQRHPDELTTQQARKLIHRMADFGTLNLTITEVDHDS